MMSNNKEEKKEEKKEENKEKKICEFEDCKRKLGILGFTCRCNKTFCAKHRLHFDHKCTHNFVKDNQDNLTKVLNKVVVDKLEKI